MNAIANDSRLIAIALADGNATATITPADAVQLSNDMQGHALAIADAILTAENTIETSAKSWACNVFNLVKVHGFDRDSLADQSRKAMGWKNLVGPAGSKVKTRFNTLSSRVGILCGKWDELSDEQRNDLLGGVKSVNTVYDEVAKAEKAATKAEAAAKAAEEKAKETDPANPPATATETIEFEPLSAIELLTCAFDEMDMAQMVAIQNAFAAMTAAYDSRVNALLDEQAKAA